MSTQPTLRELCAKAVTGPFWLVSDGSLRAQLALRCSPETMLAVIEALEGAKESLNAWNGDIALAEYQHSPEIKRINAALALLNGETP